MNFFFFLKLIIWNIDIHTCLLDSTFLCPHLLFDPKKNQKLVGVMGAYLKHSFNVRHEEKMKYMLGVSIFCLRVYSFTIWLWYCSGDVLFLCFSLFICRPCAYFYVFHCISVYFALLVTVPWIKRVYYLHKL